MNDVCLAGGDGEIREEGDGAVGQAGMEGFAVDEFLDDVVDADVGTGIVNGDDVGMIQSGDGTGFEFETFTAFGVGGGFGRETLMATVRERRVSRALLTSPMPPAPILGWI